MQRFLTFIASATLTMGAFVAPAAHADAEYPSRPITLVVPFAPGGGADLTARLVSEPLSKKLGQPIIIENRPGGGGTVGARYVADAKPDGYTLLYTTPGQQLTNPFLMDSLPYDYINGLTPVSRIAIVPSVLVVNKDVEATTIGELIELAKAKPGNINFASAGIGASSHLSGELFKVMADVDITHVPYRGTGPAVQDVIGGRVQMAIDSVTVYLPHIASGLVRPLGVTTLHTLDSLPEVPPIADELEGFDSSPVNYLSAPGQTPAAIVETLNQALNEVLETPDVREQMLNVGLLPEGNTVEEMQALVASEQEKWKRVIEESGATMD